MFKKILLATDGSANALKAAEAAKDLATKTPGSVITILHVVALTPDIIDQFSRQIAEHSVSTDDIINLKARSAIHATQKIFEDSGIPFEVVIKTGNPYDVICSVANEGNFNLCVLGSRGISDLQKILLGSVSYNVAHSCKCAVLIVK